MILVPSRDRAKAPIIDWQEIRNNRKFRRYGSSICLYQHVKESQIRFRITMQS